MVGGVAFGLDRWGGSDQQSSGTSGGTPATAASLEAPESNTWIELRTEGAGPPRYRTDHGGAVYLPHRNSVLLFGSDTHLRNFDNRVFELLLERRRWSQPYERTPRYVMRTNAEGIRISGPDGRIPWPMHVYDSMVYDPAGERVVVVSGAKHTFIPAPGAQIDPVWAYSMDENHWTVLGGGAGAPSAFAAAAVYDPTRDAILAYAPLAETTPFVPLAGELDLARSGVWELGRDRSTWRRVSDGAHHRGWFNAEFDVANRAMLVFGGDRDDSSIWVYRVGDTVGAPGQWERRYPEGDSCPGGYYFPAAYDDRRRVTLFMPHDPESGKTISCIYDFSRNVVRRLPGADLPYLGLNYTMVYAEAQDVFILFTGSFSRGLPMRVWMLRLDLGSQGR